MEHCQLKFCTACINKKISSIDYPKKSRFIIKQSLFFFQSRNHVTVSNLTWFLGILIKNSMQWPFVDFSATCESLTSRTKRIRSFGINYKLHVKVPRQMNSKAQRPIRYCILSYPFFCYLS